MPWSLIGNIKGPAGPPGAGATPPIVKPTDQAFTLVAQTAIGGLSAPITEAGTYHFRAVLWVTAAAATTGPRPGVTTAGTAPSRLGYRTETPISATAAALSFNAAGAAAAGLVAAHPIMVEGFATWSAAPVAGTALNLTMASEVLNSAVTVLAGSFLEPPRKMI